MTSLEKISALNLIERIQRDLLMCKGKMPDLALEFIIADVEYLQKIIENQN
jgi:hypothetical protein